MFKKLFLLLFILPCAIFGAWVNNETVVPTIFYQGMSCTQAQCSKYTKELTIASGDFVKSSRGIDVIEHPFVGSEIPEVVMNTNNSPWYVKYNPFSLRAWFSSFINKASGLSTRPQTNGNARTKNYSIDVGQFNFGQDIDIANHKAKWDDCQKAYGKGPRILYGVSRGAGATFDALAFHKYLDVALCVLEGCFDSIPNVLSEQRKTLNSYIKLDSFILSALERFTAYKRDGIAPIRCVDQFPKNIPVVFITSKIDKVVPYVCTYNLAQSLANSRESTDAPVYFFSLENSRHESYPTQIEEEKKAYQSFLHTLYRAYGLPYIPDFVDESLELEAYKLASSSC